MFSYTFARRRFECSIGQRWPGGSRKWTSEGAERFRAEIRSAILRIKCVEKLHKRRLWSIISLGIAENVHP